MLWVTLDPRSQRRYSNPYEEVVVGFHSADVTVCAYRTNDAALSQIAGWRRGASRVVAAVDR